MLFLQKHNLQTVSVKMRTAVFYLMLSILFHTKMVHERNGGNKLKTLTFKIVANSKGTKTQLDSEPTKAKTAESSFVAVGCLSNVNLKVIYTVKEENM